MIRRPSWKAGSGWEALQVDLEALPVGQEATPDGRERSVGPPGGPGVVQWFSRLVRSGQEALPESREWSGGLLRRPREVRRHS